MRCDEAERALSDVRYETAENAAELREHLAGCAACRALKARHDALDRVLALEVAAAPSADFDERFFAKLEAERARSKRRRRLAIGAAILPLAAAIGLVVLHQRQTASDPMILAQLPASDVELAVDLDLVEDLAVVEHMDEIEAYEELRDVDEAELDRIVRETR